ncbi:MAG: hypothetical protein KF847_08130 [Pirellulales bacterium]|nr:hypothetical protein [Pirellulales bacterium]
MNAETGIPSATVGAKIRKQKHTIKAIDTPQIIKYMGSKIEQPLFCKSRGAAFRERSYGFVMG